MASRKIQNQPIAIENRVKSDKNEYAVRIPDLILYAKFLLIGFAVSEVGWISYYLTTGYKNTLGKILHKSILTFDKPYLYESLIILLSFWVCSKYAKKRDIVHTIGKLLKSKRIDLLITFSFGVSVSYISSNFFVHFYRKIEDTGGIYGLLLLFFLLTPQISTILRRPNSSSANRDIQTFFSIDTPIDSDNQDLLGFKEKAEIFSKNLIANLSQPGIIFGVDGIWGIGKSGFVNLAASYWAKQDNVITVRFEPLRYSSDTDLTERLIKEITAEIQKKFYVPELKPTVSKYLRAVKGKADISFFGFKLNIEQGQETVDELLEDIDEVLSNVFCKVIIVIDDLDRLEAKAINNMLFAMKRTFGLKNASYVVCFDSELLCNGKEEETKARDFLEKFITAKVNLQISPQNITDILDNHWQKLINTPIDNDNISNENIKKIIKSLSELLKEKDSRHYLELIGNIRKLKRFTNTLIITHLHATNFENIDFNQKDLIHLTFIYLLFPGVFRKIYWESTTNNPGIFHVTFDKEDKAKNSSEFEIENKKFPDLAQFLTNKIFDVTQNGVSKRISLTEPELASRLCFNDGQYKNLKKAVKLLADVEPIHFTETYIFFKKSADRIVSGEKVENVYEEIQSNLLKSEMNHRKFWVILRTQAKYFRRDTLLNVIDYLIINLPNYSDVGSAGGLRNHLVIQMLIMLEEYNHRINKESKGYIAKIILNNNSKNESILSRLIKPSQGLIGWSDMMSFRLFCCYDRTGQYQKICEDLLFDHGQDYKMIGDVESIVKNQMRKISQTIFKLFKHRFIEEKINFFQEAEKITDSELRGSFDLIDQDDENKSNPTRIAATRTCLSIFVINQFLMNTFKHGSGIGCGYYDESGIQDNHGISNLTQKYLLNTCFNLSLSKKNALYFVDYMLSDLSPKYEAIHEDKSRKILIHRSIDLFDHNSLKDFWIKNGREIITISEQNKERTVTTYNYQITYSDYTADLFIQLREIFGLEDSNVS